MFNEDITVKSIQQAKHIFKTGNLREKLAKYHSSNVDCAFWGWNDVWLDPDFKDWNIEYYLPKIKVPTLIIQGKNDQYGTRRQVDGIQAGIGKKAEVEIIPECGHSPLIDQPDITLKFVARFNSALSDS